jgi:hypothetical protein
MKLKEIGVSVLETTSAGSIAAVASNLFATPIKRTKKKKDKNPSIYDSANPKYKNTQVKGKDPVPSKSKPTSGHQSPHPFRGKLVGEGDMEADREAGIKWVDNPDWERLHNMDLDMVKDFLGHKESVSEQPAAPMDPQVAQKATSLKTVAGGTASGAMVAKGLDKIGQGGTMPPALVKAIAPYARAIQKMLSDPQLFSRFKALMKLANKADTGASADAAVGRKLGESLTRQHFQMFANLLRDIEDRDKREDHAEFLIRAFKQDNERFDVQRFLKAADLVTEKAPPGREKQVKALKKKFKGDKSAPYAIAWAQHNKGKK